MLTPWPGETESNFMERCKPVVIANGEAGGDWQAVAICHSMYEQKDQSMPQAPKLYAHNFKVQASSGVHFQTINDTEYMVAPVVAVMEIVLNGILLPAKEIDHFPEAWNGVPVPVGHPNEFGWPISAKSSIDQLFKAAGWFFNVAVDAKDHHKLRGEIWIDIQRAITIGGDLERAYSQIRSGFESEVSSAFYADIENTQGTLDGVEYLGIFRNIIPDHLAILLDEKGACNREDGCGVPNPNSAGDQVPALYINKESDMNRESIIQALIACECCTLDRDALEALSDDALVAMAAMRDKFIMLRANAETSDTGDAGNTEPVADDNEDTDDNEDNDTDDTPAISPITEALARINAFIDEWSETLKGLRKNDDDDRQALIADIVANSNLEPAMLESLSIDALTTLGTDLVQPANYSGRAIRSQSTTGKSTRMKMPKIDEVE